MNKNTITTKDDQILNINTAFRILTDRISSALSNNLNIDIIKECRIIKNNCTIKLGNSKIFVKIKDKTQVDLITNSIIKLFNNTYLYNKYYDKFNRKITTKVIDASSQYTKGKKFKPLKTIEMKCGTNSVVIFITDGKLPEILKPGGLNESFLEILILEQLEVIKDAESEIGSIFPDAFRDPKLHLRLYLANTSLNTKIGPILRVNTIGGVRINNIQQKPDVSITTRNKKYNISIKQNVFPEWSSAMNYQGAKSIIDYLQSSKFLSIGNGDFIINNNSYKAIAFPASIGEIKKFCFNDDEIDFIIVNTFTGEDIISNLIKGSNNNYYIDVKCDKIYSNSRIGHTNLKKNVYLVISKSETKSSKLMPGYRISFVPKNKLRGAHIIDEVIEIPGRL